uniref:NADH-ubiquinone oxidoreductase chain 2 n=1 Tax=Acanthochitona avicula TaxID=1503212 RepID=A0A6H1PHT7_9MOLL|nr:NADH dehydrogenase subunit 2 [Acanthochitona avicula]QIZ12681.1 NADH dehydrogenase subunit 2 [Acanthochitona avicula]
MVNFPFVMVFSFIMVFGTLFSLSSSQWFGVWLGLEINLLSFVPIMVEKGGSLETEAAVKYFLVQAVGSAFFLLGILGLNNNYSVWEYSMGGGLFNFSLLVFAVVMKLGSAPLHFWVPGVVGSLSWFCNFLLLTWQKIVPLFILCSFLDMSKFVLLVLVFMSSLFGGVGGVNQSSIRSIIAYSSILHLGWILGASVLGFVFSFFYFLLYSLILAFFCILMVEFESVMSKQFLDIYVWGGNLRGMLVYMLLSLGGMPPMLGFFGKWVVLVGLIQSGYLFMSIVLVLGSILSLYYYLVLSFSLILSFGSVIIKKEVQSLVLSGLGIFMNLFGLIGVFWFFMLS